MAKIIGIVGDPNCGKSVLTHLLYRELSRRNLRTLMQEGEIFSPTPPWYLEGRDRKLADELRRKYKIRREDYARRKLSFILRSLDNLRQNENLDVVVVDIGGGMPPRERVTEINRQILDRIDGVLVLCRRDIFEDCVKGWINEIRKKNKNVRILGVCSTSLEGESDVDFEKGRCHLVGLVRGVAVNPPEHLEKAAKKLGDVIEEQIMH